ncbi:MAG: hypothetical protein US25_C0083G0004 [Candidatus Moranbacteria bacterium GW2011_GWE1_36_7]|nr:MAG: hypothetical protein UR99_C0066G0004 [Candidatus Moranbacteria bacterium GW2011_GWD2_36_12]KKQ04538.1 MAG: hypothetical protein US16_C0055G0004 [Candidatus Moranbacteria bacterium GW2011_GWE2_36_40]KKQ11477.1 MAG: hypothetical protein US25_C0083G0004 [Candidatus Moranbacteria bacterium GW2011_GWE1_36_7]
MQSVNWQQFGLKSNPYDTLPLIEGGYLSIEDAFVGRDKEIAFLDNLFDSERRGCLAICGNVGVGKTSLANFQKVIWKYKKSKLLFSSRREIEASDLSLNKKSFLLEVIGSIIREIELVDPELLKDEFISKLNRLLDIVQTTDISGGASILGFGGDFGMNKNFTQPLEIPISMLEKYFSSLIDFIKQREIGGYTYSGIVVHVNNFDVVLMGKENKKKVIQFFNEIRDVLQTPDVYYLFLGPNNLFKDIIGSQDRVKSVFFRTPLRIDPLSKSELIQAFEKRMELLKSDDIPNYIKPVKDEVVYNLYDLYGGDIRLIMSSVSDILSKVSDKFGKSLSIDEARMLLAQERWERIEELIKLTEEQKTILKSIIKSKDPVSQKEIANSLGKAQSNISGYYFKPLRDNDIIEEKGRIKNMPLWGLTRDYEPLKWLADAQEKMQLNLAKESNQLSLEM